MAIDKIAMIRRVVSTGMRRSRLAAAWPISAPTSSPCAARAPSSPSFSLAGLNMVVPTTQSVMAATAPIANPVIGALNGNTARKVVPVEECAAENRDHPCRSCYLTELFLSGEAAHERARSWSHATSGGYKESEQNQKAAGPEDPGTDVEDPKHGHVHVHMSSVLR